MSARDLRVGDTIPPVLTPVLRVSVEDDHSYLLDYNEAILRTLGAILSTTMMLKLVN